MLRKALTAFYLGTGLWLIIYLTLNTRPVEYAPLVLLVSSLLAVAGAYILGRVLEKLEASI